MANTYKNIVITPNIGSNVEDPKIVFSGGNDTVNTDIILKVYPTSNGTLSFESTTQELVTFTNDLTNVVFSVARSSDNIPAFEIASNGHIYLSPFASSNVSIGKKILVPYTGDFLFGSNTLDPSFTLTENYNNVVFSINRTDTAPSMEAYANGDIALVPFGGDLNFGGAGVTANMNFYANGIINIMPFGGNLNFGGAGVTSNMNFVGDSVINTSAFVMTTDNSNVIFSINRTLNDDGIPSFEVLANGEILINSYESSNVSIGKNILVPYTGDFLFGSNTLDPSFTLTENYNNVVFSINRTDTAPSMEAYANGDIALVPFGGDLTVAGAPIITTGKSIAMAIVFG